MDHTTESSNGSGSNGQTGEKLLHQDANGEIVVCCYRCFNIYSKYSHLNDRVDYMHKLLGISSSACSTTTTTTTTTTTASTGDGLMGKSIMTNNMGSTILGGNMSKVYQSGNSSILRPSVISIHGNNREGRDQEALDDTINLIELIRLIRERYNMSHISRSPSLHLPYGSVSNIQNLGMKSPIRTHSPTGGGSSRGRPSSTTSYCSYHSIPYGVLHWRVLIMFHYAILEDSDKLNTLIDAMLRNGDHSPSPTNTSPTLPSTSRKSYTTAAGTGIGIGPTGKRKRRRRKKGEDLIPRYLAVHYTFGQQKVFIPFLVKQNKLSGQQRSRDDLTPGSNTTTSSSKRRKTRRGRMTTIKVFKKEQTIPIQECRLHCLCGRPEDVVDYLKDMLVPCKLFSMIEREEEEVDEEDNNDGRRDGEGRNEKADFGFPKTTGANSRRSTSAFPFDLPKTDNSTPLSPLRDQQQQQQQQQQQHGHRDFILQEEDKRVYHPPCHYIPSELTLPESWLSMMLSMKTTASATTTATTTTIRAGLAKKGDGGGNKSLEKRLSIVSRRSSHDNSEEDNEEYNEEEEDDDDSSSLGDSSSIDVNDGEDDLIERLLDREIRKEKEARQEILHQRKIAEERENRLKLQLQNERSARKAGEAAISSAPRLIRPSTEKNWNLVNNTVAATMKLARMARQASMERIVTSNDDDDDDDEKDGDGDNKADEGQKQGSVLVKHHSMTAMTGTSSNLLNPPRRATTTNINVSDEPVRGKESTENAEEDKKKRRSRIMNKLAQVLKAKAHEAEDETIPSPSLSAILPSQQSFSNKNTTT
eukprot:scaffold650_cov201-Ochromonas_danica.AAC.5